MRNSSKDEKRVVFPKGEQFIFLNKIKTLAGCSNRTLALRIGITERSFRDWLREKTLMTETALVSFCVFAKIERPKNIHFVEKYWYTKKGAALGGKAKVQKYGYYFGDEAHRKSKWREWWDKKGSVDRNKILIARKITIPQKSVDLSEFTGIMLGDGGITNRQVVITLNGVDDKEFVTYVMRMIERIFKTKPSLLQIKDSKAVNIVISSTNLVLFCKNTLGLKIGNKLKQKVDIPLWIYEDIEYQKACIRGLVDTDGCFFTEKHPYKGKIYEYGRLNFVSYSPYLQDSVYKILTTLGFHPTKRRLNKAVQLENKQEICNYFKVIGTSNEKHRRKFERLYTNT